MNKLEDIWIKNLITDKCITFEPSEDQKYIIRLLDENRKWEERYERTRKSEERNCEENGRLSNKLRIITKEMVIDAELRADNPMLDEAYNKYLMIKKILK